jgi:hypothetical protein
LKVRSFAMSVLQVLGFASEGVIDGVVWTE